MSFIRLNHNLFEYPQFNSNFLVNFLFMFLNPYQNHVRHSQYFICWDTNLIIDVQEYDYSYIPDKEVNNNFENSLL